MGLGAGKAFHGVVQQEWIVLTSLQNAYQLMMRWKEISGMYLIKQYHSSIPDAHGLPFKVNDGDRLLHLHVGSIICHCLGGLTRGLRPHENTRTNPDPESESGSQMIQ